jgi:hypothetical protein
MRDSHHTTLVIGRKHTGKSTYLNRIAKSYPKDLKVLIIDVNGSPAYAEHPEIKISQIRQLESGIVKLIGTPKKDDLLAIAKHFRDGLIVFEDCTKYIEGNVAPEIKAFLVDHRMHRADLIFTFHAFRRVPPFFWEMSSYVTIMKTQEQIDTSRNRNNIPNFDEVYNTWKEVMASPSEYENATIETLV